MVPFGAFAHEEGYPYAVERLDAIVDEIGVADDQISAPTWAYNCRSDGCVVCKLSNADSTENHIGIHHLTCAGCTSWYGFVSAIFEETEGTPSRSLPRIEAIPAKEYPLPAMRPSSFRPDNRKLVRDFGIAVPSWQTALRCACGSCDDIYR